MLIITFFPPSGSCWFKSFQIIIPFTEQQRSDVISGKVASLCVLYFIEQYCMTMTLLLGGYSTFIWVRVCGPNGLKYGLREWIAGKFGVLKILLFVEFEALGTEI